MTDLTLTLLDELIAFIDNPTIDYVAGPYPTKFSLLVKPDLKTIQSALQTGLQKNFKSVTVSIVNCPDLTSWSNSNLAAAGICGNCQLAEVGGVPLMFHKNYQTRNYSMHEIAKSTKCSHKKTLIIGAGAACGSVINNNAELMPNTVLNKINRTKFSYVKPEDNQAVVQDYNFEYHGCLSNLFLSDGKCNQPVVYIKVKQRIGDLNFTNCIRESLKQYKGQIGLGGVIKVLAGKIKSHVMPCYTCCDYNDSKAVNDWLNFYECGPDLLMFSCLLTGDPTPNESMHLRLEHTHFYSISDDKVKRQSEGGHYHYDTTPDIIEYEAYFSLVDCIWRIDDGYDLLNINPEHTQYD